MNITALEMEMAEYRRALKYRRGNLPDTSFLDTVKTEQDPKETKAVSIEGLKEKREEGVKGSYSRIIVKPDGSRVLLVTTRVSGMETTMSLKISEPTDLQMLIVDGEDEGSGTETPKKLQNVQESVVEAYRQKHPEEAYHVDCQVKAGKRVLAGNHAEHFLREKMSMEAYQHFIMGIIYSIPFDPSRAGDQQIVQISDEGWEQMKKDPEYEAWVLGYLAEDRAVRNPFAGLPGATSCFSIENFGASIEEHHGHGFSMERPERKSFGKQETQESWWEKRCKRARQLMKEQEKKAQIKREVRMEQERELYHQRVMENRQRLEAFLHGDTLEIGQLYHTYDQNYVSPELLASAILAYNRRTVGK